MIIYSSTKAGFLDDAFDHEIETGVLGAYHDRTGLLAMAKLLRHDSIPDDCGIAIEAASSTRRALI